MFSLAIMPMAINSKSNYGLLNHANDDEEEPEVA